MRAFSLPTVSSILLSTAFSAPHSSSPHDISPRDGSLTPQQVIKNLEKGVRDGAITGGIFFGAVESQLRGLEPTATPTSIPQALSALESILASKPTDFFQTTINMIEKGLLPGNIEQALDAYNSPENSPIHSNPRNPSKPIYPRAGPDDAPYTQSAPMLRQQIYIPPEFTYGEKQPVIFVPGTGARGFLNFDRNIAKYLRGTPHADPVYINPPGFQLDDAQLNAENVAYAINYISGISKNRKVAVITWSQGGISAQWALKYWPSARSKVNNLVAISPDYYGTVLAGALCGFAQLCPPSVLQQQRGSAFIAALRNGQGNSSFVPTTNIYSALFDEIVEPQQGTAASAYLLNNRGAGVTNVELQSTCGADTPGGGIFGHETVLAASLTKALVMDALKNGGVASLDRINVNEVCKNQIATGLNAADLLQTESLIPLAAFEIVAYPNKMVKGPGVKPYAYGK